MARTATQTTVARVEEAPKNLATAVPDFMAQYAGQGTENIGQNDVETPRIKLLQGLSPEIEQFDDAKVGQFWHSLLNMNLGSSLTVVPVWVDKMAILWNPRESGGGILARSYDLINWTPEAGEAKVKINKGTKEVTWKWGRSVTASRLMEWGSSDPGDSNSQPAATAMVNIVVALPDYPDLPPGVVTLQRSTMRPARKFMGQLKMVRAPSFGCKFNMSVISDRNKVGQEFKSFQFNPMGMVDNEQQFHLYRQYYETFKEMGLQIKDIDNLADEDAAREAGAATEADPNAPAY